MIALTLSRLIYLQAKGLRRRKIPKKGSPTLRAYYYNYRLYLMYTTCTVQLLHAVGNGSILLR